MIKPHHILFFLLFNIAWGHAVLGASHHLSYHLETQSRIGYHLITPIDLSSHRHELEANLTDKFEKYWTFVSGIRAFAEGAYASNGSRYGNEVRTRDSQEISLRDLYLQFKSGPLFIRLGNQEVVWGEAFGFYYADIINPKDFRDFGLGPIAHNRIPSPMLNIKVSLAESSLQLLYLPKPYFDKLPSLGSDFAFPFQKFFAGVPMQTQQERSLPIGSANGEYGAKMSSLLGTLDTSLLFFSYFDRNPNYESSVQTSGVNIHYVHHRIYTLGLTTSLPLGVFILRTEALYHKDKFFDTFALGTIQGIKSNEIVGVLGVDYTATDRFRLGLQYSDNHCTDEIAGALLPRSRQLLSLHGNLAIYREQTFDFIASYTPRDGSTLVQLSYLVPISKRFEILFGADLLNGSSNSQFGQYHSATRGYLQLRTYLGEEEALRF